MSELEEKKKKRSKKGGTKDGKGSKSKGYNLRDWFKGGGWVQVGGKYDGKPCAKQPGQKTKPYCRDPDDRSKMGKKEKEKRAKKKRKEDPNPNRRGKAKNVSQKSKKRKNESMQLTTEQITKIIIEELNVILYESLTEEIKQLERLWLDKENWDQVYYFVTSLQNPDINKWYKGKLAELDQKVADSLKEVVSLKKERRKIYVKRQQAIERRKKLRVYEPNDYELLQIGKERREIEQQISEAEAILDSARERRSAAKSLPTPTEQSLQEFQQVIDERSRKKRKAARKRKKAKTTKKDACYRKVKSRYKVWPSAYASGALVKCRKVGAKNWGNKSKKNESLNEEYINEEEMNDKDRKELERIRDKLYGASKAHKGQADDLDKILKEEELEEAVYNGKTVKLNKPMRGDVKKFKVYVNSGKKDAKGRIKAKKVNFGHGGTSAKRKGEKTMKIRKSNPKARKNFRARHNCDNPGPKTKARYWSCRKW